MHVGREVRAPARPYAGLRGQVEDAVDALEQRFEIRLDQVRVVQAEPGLLLGGRRRWLP